MAESVEIEYKSMLSATEFQQVITYFHLNEENFHTQTNFYFDTPDQKLKALGCGLRIRLTATKGELTLKTPLAEGLLETTDTFSPSQAQEFLATGMILLNGTVAEALRRLGIDPTEVRLFTQLKTKRAEFSIPAGLLALDESWYGATGHDYELELEVKEASQGQAEFRSLLQRLGVQEKPAVNKIQRAFKEMQR